MSAAGQSRGSGHWLVGKGTFTVYMWKWQLFFVHQQQYSGFLQERAGFHLKISTSMDSLKKIEKRQIKWIKSIEGGYNFLKNEMLWRVMPPWIIMAWRNPAALIDQIRPSLWLDAQQDCLTATIHGVKKLFRQIIATLHWLDTINTLLDSYSIFRSITDATISLSVYDFVSLSSAIWAC